MRKNKQQTLVRGKRVVVDKTLNLVVPKTLILPKTYTKHEFLPKVSKESRLYVSHSGFGNNFHKPVSDPI